MRTHHILLTAILACLLPPNLAAGSQAVWRFKLIEVPKLNLPGNTFSNPTAINDQGQVTGESGSLATTVGLHAFLWSPGQPMVNLDDGKWPATSGLFINESGLIAGDATFCPQENGGCPSQPLLIEPDGQFTELEPIWLGYLVMQGINEAGMVIFNRNIDNESNYIRPRQWRPGTGTLVLPVPSSAFSGYALDQDQSGNAVGYSIGAGYTPHIWTDGTISSLETEPGGDGWAHCINESGTIIGRSTFNGNRHATRWMNAQSSPERLIDDPMALESDGTHLLEDGTVLGTWTNSDNQVLTYRIAPDGTVDLLAPPESQVKVLEVVPVTGNTNGWILCMYVNEFFQIQSVVHIPEEGWVFPNNRLLGFGSQTSELPIDMNQSGQIITRGAQWTSPAFLDAMPPGDVNGDKTVGVDDILGVLEAFGICNPSPSRLCDADVTANGTVDVDDVLGVINNWPAP